MIPVNGREEIAEGGIAEDPGRIAERLEEPKLSPSDECASF